MLSQGDNSDYTRLNLIPGPPITIRRGRLVVYHDVDVVVMVEPEPGVVAAPRIIHAANRKTVLEISDEIRSFQGQPESGERGGRLSAFATRVPRFVRLGFFRPLKWNPHWFKRLSGTVIVTSVGNIGGAAGGAWTSFPCTPWASS